MMEWVEIVEPRTKEHMYANLTTGECAWEPPQGVPVKRTSDDQWWELYDSNTGRYYYYNASSQKTVWHRPINCDIIPLAKLQTLKQNTEAPNRLGTLLGQSPYDVPRSPSTSSSKSTHSTPTQCAKPWKNSKIVVSCETQTSPNCSPNPKKKQDKLKNSFTKQSSGSQTGLSSSSRDSSRHRNAIPQPVDHNKTCRTPCCDQEFEDAILKLQGEEIAAEVQRFFDQNQERLNKESSPNARSRLGSVGLPKFPVPPIQENLPLISPAHCVPPSPGGKIRKHSQPSPADMRSGPFVRSFVFGASPTLPSSSKHMSRRVEDMHMDAPNPKDVASQSSPIPALRNSLRTFHKDQETSVSPSKLPKRQQSLDSAPATNARFRKSQNSISPNPQARTASTRKLVEHHDELMYREDSSPQPTNIIDSGTGSSAGSQSVESTPNLPRRQKSFDYPSSLKHETWSVSSMDSASGLATPARNRKYVSPPIVKEAQITAIAGNTSLWGSKAHSSSSNSNQDDNKHEAPHPPEGSPVWTRCNEVAMMKSLDSGIKSSDSTAERPIAEIQPNTYKMDHINTDNRQRLTPHDEDHDSSLDSPKERSEEGGTSSSAPSPRPRPRLSLRKGGISSPAIGYGFSKTPPPTSKHISLARPYQQLAPHLAYSQLHHQFILEPLDSKQDSNNMSVTINADQLYGYKNGTCDSIVSSDDEDDVLAIDEDVFADDEDGEQSPVYSSQEDMSSRSTSSLALPMNLSKNPVSHSRRHGSSPTQPDPTKFVHPPQIRAPSASPNPYGSHFHPGRRIHDQPFQTLNNNKRKSDTDGSSTVSSINGTGERINNYPGDISPPCHRPQSMLVGPQTDQLPPNTATLSRSQRANNGNGGNSVTRSASSLTRNIPLSGLSLYSDQNMESYAQENINRHKKGIFRKRQSIASMLSWTRESIKQPLIMTSDKVVKKDACGIFKRIQAYMGDRKVRAGICPDKMALDICLRGWAKPQTRDEIFIQIAKQTTDNPKNESLRRGWELLAICLNFFCPSPNLQSFMETYINRNSDNVLDPPDVPVSHYAQHCAKRLERYMETATKNSNGQLKKGLRKPGIEDIGLARVHIFNPSLFGNSLEEVMLIQREKFPNRELPWVQTTLSELVLQLKGAQTEGIFRVPGDIDEVNSLKTRIDRYLLPSVSDPHVPASLLKLWYRELAQPLIPPHFYNRCLEAADDPGKACNIVDRMPRINRLVLAYLVRFLQIFIRQENSQISKMDSSNLAMVMAPNCLRCQSEDPRIIFDNTRKEMGFLRTLIDNLDTTFMEGVQ